MHRSTSLASLALLIGSTLTACGRSTGEAVILPPPQGPDYFFEIEPNDTPFTADFIQFVDPFTDTIIEGYLDGGPPGLFDTYDHFAFTATVPAVFSFELYAANPVADLAVGVFDPSLGVFVGWWDSPFDVEFGSFVVHEGNTDFQIVIHAPGLGSDYSLDLFGFPYTNAPESKSPERDASTRSDRDASSISVDPDGLVEDRSQTVEHEQRPRRPEISTTD